MEILQIILAVVNLIVLIVTFAKVHSLFKTIENIIDETILMYTEYVVTCLKNNKKPKPFSKWAQS